MADYQFDRALRLGFPWVWVVHVHGLPWVWVEKVPKRVSSTAPIGLPSGFLSAVPALLFEDRASFGVEPDSQSGVARGDALSFSLAWEALEDAELTTNLFRRPSKRSRLGASATASATSFTVDVTTGWVPGELAFIGRECVRIGSASGITLGGLTRGIAGLADRYESASPSSFADVTDRPTIYKGRRIDVYRHLLSPEGRFMQSAWMESGSLTRLEWMGVLDEHPRSGPFGMQFRATALHRRAADELGYELAMRVVKPAADVVSWMGYPIVASEGSSLILRGSYSGPSSGTWEVTVGTYTTEEATTIGGWAARVSFELDTALLGQPWYTTGVASVGWAHTGDSGEIRTDYLSIAIPYDSAYTLSGLTCVVLPVPQLYWLRPGTLQGETSQYGFPTINFRDRLKLTFSAPPGAWLVVQQTEGEGWQDLAVPSSGAALLEEGDQKELLRWDRIEAAAWVDPRWVLLHLVERGAAGTSLVDLTAVESAELKFVSGATGTAAQVILTLLQSSGAGNRGTYDTLALGLGCGIEEAAIDVAKIAADPDLGAIPITAYAGGRTSLVDLVGGWLALNGKCLAMRVVDSDRAKITLVDLSPVVFGPDTPSLERADVELSGVGHPERVESPNEIRVSREGIRGDASPAITQDRVAIQAEGAASFETSAPGMSVAQALALGGTRIAAGNGTELIAVQVVPGVPLWIGDTCVVRLAHPSTYHWGTGQRGPATIAACVVGDTPTADGRRKLVLLMAGVLAEGNYLAPCITVDAVSGSQLEFWGAFNLTQFAGNGAVIRVRLYNPGVPSESGTYAGTVAGEDILTLDAAAPAWVTAGVTQMTMGDLGTGDAEFEELYHFQSSSKRWSP